MEATYKNRDAARIFAHYIAESQRQNLQNSITSCIFYSVLMDDSVDKGKIEHELFIILTCAKDDCTYARSPRPVHGIFV